MPGPAAKALGFSLLEVIVVIGIFTIAAAIALPHLMDWRHGLRLRAAVNEVRGDLERAKSRAVKENATVSVAFLPAEGRYHLTYPDPEGNLVSIKSQALPQGVRFAVENPDYTFDSSGNKTSFTSRGTAQPGALVLENERGKRRSIVVNFLGRIDVRD
ncbi:MAG: GspH/FimT family pseudopilin [Desulfobacterales bacterium]|jgi:prepilin-type N-terminal cleavage/methylation domain-containing protein|nr:GspH/FimT family pseudopilin [Desulfobacterales bacterium]